MIKKIMKMGGCKTEAEFYKKYPTEESFLEAFPQARPMMEQYQIGGVMYVPKAQMGKFTPEAAERSTTSVAVRNPEMERQAANATAERQRVDRMGRIYETPNPNVTSFGKAMGLPSGQAAIVGQRQAMMVPAAVGTGILGTIAGTAAMNPNYGIFSPGSFEYGEGNIQMPRKKQTGGVAFPQAPTADRFFNYGAPTPNIPRFMQEGGALESKADEGQAILQIIQAVSEKYSVDPQEIVNNLQQEVDEETLQLMTETASSDPDSVIESLDSYVANMAGGEQKQPMPTPYLTDQPYQQQLLEQQYQEEEPMPQDPNMAIQMAYGGSKLRKFTKGYQTGGTGPRGGRLTTIDGRAYEECDTPEGCYDLYAVDEFVGPPAPGPSSTPSKYEDPDNVRIRKYKDKKNDGSGKRKVKKFFRTIDREARDIKRDVKKFVKKCLPGERCSNFQDGGAYYDPGADMIFNLNNYPPGEREAVEQHELFHRLQNRHDALRVPDAYPGPLRRPSAAATSPMKMAYWNRRMVDMDIMNDQFFDANPSFGFVPYDLTYDYIINPSMYSNPWTAEGEAKEWEDAYREGRVSEPLPRDFQTGGQGGGEQTPFWDTAWGTASKLGIGAGVGMGVGYVGQKLFEGISNSEYLRKMYGYTAEQWARLNPKQRTAKALREAGKAMTQGVNKMTKGVKNNKGKIILGIIGTGFMAASELLEDDPAAQGTAAPPSVRDTTTNKAKVDTSEQAVPVLSPYAKEQSPINKKGGVPSSNYGQFSIIMQKGGSAPMGIMRPDDVSSKRIQNLQKYVDDNVTIHNDTKMMENLFKNPFEEEGMQMPQDQMKYGGFKKKSLLGYDAGGAFIDFDDFGSTGDETQDENPLEDEDFFSNGSKKSTGQNSELDRIQRENRKLRRQMKRNQRKEDDAKADTGMGRFDVTEKGARRAGFLLGTVNSAIDSRQKSIDKKAQDQLERRMFDQLSFASKPSNKGFHMVNNRVPVPPTMQTPVQFTGKNYTDNANVYGYAKSGGEMYLSDDEIQNIISLGGEVEYLD
jgi:hypothetical protein